MPAVKKDIYNISYEGMFSGPIDLLLDLIQKKKIDIYDIKLSYIISGFCRHIKEKSGIVLDTVSGFIYFFSILLEIKSRSLLPSKTGDDDIKDDLDVNILKRREEDYRIYKKVSNYLNNKIDGESLFFIREAPLEKDLLNVLPDFIERLDSLELWSIAGRLLIRMNIELGLDDIYDHRSTVDIFEEMERIKSVIWERKEVTFREISAAYEKLIDRIISFLAVLELYKNEEVEILQFENFGNIIIRSNGR